MEYIAHNNLSVQEQELVERALQEESRHYNPKGLRYATAALRCEDGNIYTGASIRRMGAGSSTCSERMAIDQAIFHKSYVPVMLAVVGYTKDGSLEEIISPCGSCRQTLAEMILETGEERDVTILLTNAGGTEVIRTGFKELFPLAYKGATKLL